LTDRQVDQKKSGNPPLFSNPGSKRIELKKYRLATPGFASKPLLKRQLRGTNERAARQTSAWRGSSADGEIENKRALQIKKVRWDLFSSCSTHPF